jgi:hypothetical protein
VSNWDNWRERLASMKKEEKFKVSAEDRSSLSTLVSKLHTELNYQKRWTIKKTESGANCIRVW